MEYGKRKPIPKAMRIKVYDKYDGHCAYCGKELKMKDMQVDHLTPIAHSCYGNVDYAMKARKMFDDGSINEIDNLMPSCRACNYYKDTATLEKFRERILTELEHTCRSTFQTRLAMQYGMIEYKPWNGKFYFETKDEKTV